MGNNYKDSNLESRTLGSSFTNSVLKSISLFREGFFCKKKSVPIHDYYSRAVLRIVESLSELNIYNLQGYKGDTGNTCGGKIAMEHAAEDVMDLGEKQSVLFAAASW